MKLSEVAGLGTGTICRRLFPLALGFFLTMALFSPAYVQAKEKLGAGKVWEEYSNAFQGKTVGFVPMALSFNIAQAYDGAMREHAKAHGYKYIVRDPNWSVESAVQIAEQYIAEKVDIIVIHPFADKAFNRVLRKAKAAGIHTIFMNLRSGAGTDFNGSDYFIGSDFYSIGKLKADWVSKVCTDSPSKKVALIKASVTNAVGILETKGFLEQLEEKYPEVKLVSIQNADADANKAKTIASTVLKQHPDLCAIVGQWDGNDIGIPPAIEEAGLKGKVKLISGGSGVRTNACDKVADGSYDAYVTYKIDQQTTLLKAKIAEIFQTNPAPGSMQSVTYIENDLITRDTVSQSPCACWDLDFVTKPLELKYNQ